MNQISEAADEHGRACPQGKRACITKEQQGSRQATRWVWPAIAAVEMLFALGLMMAITLGRWAVVLTFVVAFVLAAYVGVRLSAASPPDGRRAGNAG
jgi:hypothetical protein